MLSEQSEDNHYYKYFLELHLCRILQAQQSLKLLKLEKQE